MTRLASLIVHWEWLLLLLLLPILILPPGPIALLLLALPLLWLLRHATSGRFLPATPYDTAILLLVLMVLVTLLVTYDIHLSFPKIAGVILSVALFFAAVAYTRQQTGRLWRLLALILATGVLMALVGLPFTTLTASQPWLPAALTRMPATANPNEVAGILSWTLPLFVALLMSLAHPLWQQRPWLLILLAAITLAALALLLATRSRGGWFAFATALLAMAAIRHRRQRPLLLAAAPAVLFAAITFNAAGRFFPGNHSDQIDLAGRLEIWPRALHALADFPLTGLGMNGFRHAIHFLYPINYLPPDLDVAHAHNHLLQAGLDLGIPGLVAYLALWAISAALLWQSWPRATRSQRALILGLGGSMTAGWFFGIFDAIAIGARPGFLWWLLLALIVAIHDDVKCETKEQ